MNEGTDERTDRKGGCQREVSCRKELQPLPREVGGEAQGGVPELLCLIGLEKATFQKPAQRKLVPAARYQVPNGSVPGQASVLWLSRPDNGSEGRQRYSALPPNGETEARRGQDMES